MKFWLGGKERSCGSRLNWRDAPFELWPDYAGVFAVPVADASSVGHSKADGVLLAVEDDGGIPDDQHLDAEGFVVEEIGWHKATG